MWSRLFGLLRSQEPFRVRAHAWLSGTNRKVTPSLAIIVAPESAPEKFRPDDAPLFQNFAPKGLGGPPASRVRVADHPPAILSMERIGLLSPFDQWLQEYSHKFLPIEVRVVYYFFA